MNELRILRNKSNLSQKELAKLLGISQQAYSLIENGTCDPSMTTAKKIAVFFDTTIDELFFKDKYNYKLDK